MISKETIKTRLHIISKEKHYYDVGLRKGINILSKTHIAFGERCPRYLEDFIESVGKPNIKIIGYGTLIQEKEYIDELLR